MQNLMKGKTCLITGANSGIGKALSFALSGLGAKLILICRDPVRGENAGKEIKETTGNPDIDLQIMDMSSQKSIRAGVVKLKNKYNKLDVLINNAGVLLFDKIFTDDGLETTVATNYLGPFLLTNLLLDKLIKSGPSRIINVVSEGASNEEVDIEKLMANRKYDPVKVYSQSKQAEILFTYALARKIKETKVTSNCYYPGLVKTNLGKVEKGFRKLTYTVLTGILKSAFTPMEESVKLGLYLAASKKAEAHNGIFFIPKKGKIIMKHSQKQDDEDRLWALSEQLTGLNSEKSNGAYVLKS